MRNVHNIHEASTMEDVGRNIPKIYSTLDNRQENDQSNMIEVEGKITNQPIVILIDSRESHSYNALNLVEIFQLKKRKNDRS